MYVISCFIKWVWISTLLSMAPPVVWHTLASITIAVDSWWCLNLSGGHGSQLYLQNFFFSKVHLRQCRVFLGFPPLKRWCGFSQVFYPMVQCVRFRECYITRTCHTGPSMCLSNVTRQILKLITHLYIKPPHHIYVRSCRLIALALIVTCSYPYRL